MGLLFFIIYINAINEEKIFTISKFTDDTIRCSDLASDSKCTKATRRSLLDRSMTILDDKKISAKLCILIFANRSSTYHKQMLSSWRKTGEL